MRMDLSMSEMQEWKTLQQETGECVQRLSTLFTVYIYQLDESVVNEIMCFCGTRDNQVWYIVSMLPNLSHAV